MKSKVMIVDDASFIRLTLKEVLTKAGYDVCAEAENGIEALEYYKTHSPDFVIMDIMMPEMDGLTAAREIININPHAKIVVCSSAGEESNIKASRDCGVLEFLTKPFLPERLLSSLERMAG